MAKIPELKQVRIPELHRKKALKAAIEKGTVSWVVLALGVELATDPANASLLEAKAKKFPKRNPGPKTQVAEKAKKPAPNQIAKKRSTKSALK